MESAQQNTGGANEAKVFKAHAALLGLCDNLINALQVAGEPSDSVVDVGPEAEFQ